jgi:dTDP-glucose pyrophosphorylase
MAVDSALHTIYYKEPLSSALEKMGRSGHLRTLFILGEHNEVVGTLTDGDIRRAFLKGVQLNQECGECAFRSFRYVAEGGPDSNEIAEWKKLGINVVPVLDKQKRLVRILNIAKLQGFLPVSAVIMAGGVGSRLRPLTIDKPKPMLPVNGIPILEINIRRLISFGVDEIFISVNYLKEQIMAHFGDGSSLGCHIHYLTENEPRGTIGALSGLKGKISHNDILLFNADLLSNIQLDEMFNAYHQVDADMCMASIPYKVKVPFAVLELNDHQISGISEKPTYTYYSNAGFYMFKSAHLNRIPDLGFYNATDFTDSLIHDKKKVIQFPILGYWSDIGSIEEYQKAQDDIQYLDLY